MRLKTKIISSFFLIFVGFFGFLYFFISKPEIIVVDGKENKVNDKTFDDNKDEKSLDNKELDEIGLKSGPNIDNNLEDEKEYELGVVKDLVNWGFKTSDKRKIDTIVLHTSYNILGGDEYDLKKVILEYKEYQVSPHYVIDRKGGVFQLVEDKNIAFHAGESSVPDGRNGVNEFSLGIEILNNKEDKFTLEQYRSLNKLIKDIKSRYEIKYILGHNQISPERKTDPWNIEWSKVQK